MSTIALIIILAISFIFGIVLGINAVYLVLEFYKLLYEKEK